MQGRGCLWTWHSLYHHHHQFHIKHGHHYHLWQLYLYPGHHQSQHGYLHEPTAQAHVHASYYIYRSHNHPHRMCLYSLATSYPMVSRNDLMLLGCTLLLLCVFSLSYMEKYICLQGR